LTDFFHVADELQHLVQPVRIDHQHRRLHQHHQIIMARDRGREQDNVRENAEYPQRDHGPHRGGGDHENRREQGARGSCVFCQMRRIHGSQPTFWE
jgi:hypothetical protein